jgi:hypothetical protein
MSQSLINIYSYYQRRKLLNIGDIGILSFPLVFLQMELNIWLWLSGKLYRNLICLPCLGTHCSYHLQDERLWQDWKPLYRYGSGQWVGSKGVNGKHIGLGSFPIGIGHIAEKKKVMKKLSATRWSGKEVMKKVVVSLRLGNAEMYQYISNQGVRKEVMKKF